MKVQAMGEPIPRPDIHDDERWRTAARIEAHVMAAMCLAMMATLAVVAYTIA